MRLAILAAALLLATPAMAQQAGGAQMLAAMDANGDGQLTRAEAEAGRAAMFTRLDADHDGYLSSTERAALAQRPMGRGLANADADGDGDGRISRSEFMGQPYRGFDRLDANHDGVVSTAEMQALRSNGNGG